MKKTLGVVAAAALAAAPALAVFAVTDGESIKDVIDLTINDNCAFTRQTTAHGSETWNPAGTAEDTFAMDVVNNQTYDAFATSKFHVVCNNAGGYQVTVTPTGFTARTLGESADAWNYNGGAYADSGSSWFISSDHTGASLTGDNKTVAKTTSALGVNGEDFIVTYNAKVDTAQQADTYEATATYLFSEL